MQAGAMVAHPAVAMATAACTSYTAIPTWCSVQLSYITSTSSQSHFPRKCILLRFYHVGLLSKNAGTATIILMCVTKYFFTLVNCYLAIFHPLLGKNFFWKWKKFIPLHIYQRLHTPFWRTHFLLRGKSRKLIGMQISSKCFPWSLSKW